MNKLSKIIFASASMFLGVVTACSLTACNPKKDTANNNTSTNSAANDVTLELPDTPFKYSYGLSKAIIEENIRNNVRTNGTITISGVNDSIGTHSITIVATKDGKSVSKSATLIIADDALTFTISNYVFTFEYGVTAATIESTIKASCSTNGALTVTGIDTSLGVHTVTVFAVKGNKSSSKTITVKILEGDVTLDISKDVFTFDYGVTAATIESTIKASCSSNGSISIYGIETTAGTHTVTVFAVKGNKSVNQTVVVKIIEDDVTLDISKDEFTFEYGVTAATIESTIKASCSSNGSISIYGIETTAGTHTVTVFAVKGNKSVNQTVTVKIVEDDVILDISKDVFEFEYETTANQIKNEILKYTSSNGTISFSDFSIGKAGSQTVVVYATKGNKSAFTTVTINIKEEVVINFEIAKTSYEFPYGKSSEFIKETISSQITTNGTIAFRNIPSSAGTYNVIVDSILGNKLVSKNVSVTIKNSSSVALDFTKTDFEFLYGQTVDEMITEIAKYTISNGTLEISSYFTNCGSGTFSITAKYNGNSTTKNINVTINPDKSKLKLTYISTTNSTSKLTIRLTVENNTGKDIDEFTFLVLIHDGTYGRGFFGKTVKFPINYGTSTTLKNGETNVLSLYTNYNSNFVIKRIEDYEFSSSDITGYDYDYLHGVSSFSWKWIIGDIVFTD